MKPAQFALGAAQRPLDSTASLGAASTTRRWWWLLAALALVRLLSLPLYPLADATEARYAEIARLMLDSGEWITPQIAPGEPFLAKPPLSTWSQAASMALLGVHDWAARLPALAWFALAFWALWTLVRPALGRERAAFALTLLAAMPLVFVSAGAVMTEGALLASMLWMQTAFWRGLQAARAEPTVAATGATRRWARVLGLAAGLALLAKGPAALVLGALPGVVYLIWRRPGWAALRRLLLGDRLAWLLLLGTALPWYAAAELAQPGFIAYFVVGEHLMRFTQAGWSGDRYGFAHAGPPLVIWAYLASAALPCWLMLAAAGLGRWRRRQAGGGGRGNGAGVARAVGAAPQALLGPELARYAWAMLLAPMLLFSLSRNLIWTYALPALPGLALLAACWLDPQRQRWLPAAGWMSVLAYAAGFTLLVPSAAARHSQADSIAAYDRACPQRDCALIDLDPPRYSARFYSHGLAYAPPLPAAPPHAAGAQLAGARPVFVVAQLDHPQISLLRGLGSVLAENAATVTVKIDPVLAAQVDWLVRRPS